MPLKLTLLNGMLFTSLHLTFSLHNNYSREQMFKFADLAVTLDPKFNFTLHINTILKAKDALTFVKRWPKELF